MTVRSGTLGPFSWFFGVAVRVDYARNVTFHFAKWWVEVSW